MTKGKSAAFLMLFSMLLLGAGPAQAQFSWGGEKIIRVSDLPDNASTLIPEGANAGRYLDIGVVYKRVEILFIPVWNYDIRYAGYVGNDTNYLNLPEYTLRAIARESGGTMPNEISLPFWDAVGGKLLFGGIVLLILLFSFVSRRRRAIPAGADVPPAAPPPAA